MTGIERLRNVARDLRTNCALSIVDGNGAPLECALESIADQIEREQEDLVRETEDASGRDSDALAWVERHGGLEEVEARWSERVSLSTVKTMVERHRARRERLKAHALWLEHKCRERGETIRELRKSIAEMRPRLMPEGMEWLVEAWPRFESGEPVRIGDLFAEHVGCENVADSIEIGDCWFKIHGFDGAAPRYSKGAFVKRPATKVLDADGVECHVGDAVWWVSNKTGNFRIIRIEPDGKCAIRDDDEDEPCGMTVQSTELTHMRPVLDADGAEIRVGDTVWTTYTGDKFVVKRIDPASGELCVFVADDARKTGFWIDPQSLTHRAPVLGADGKPLL